MDCGLNFVSSFQTVVRFLKQQSDAAPYLVSGTYS